MNTSFQIDDGAPMHLEFQPVLDVRQTTPVVCAYEALLRVSNDNGKGNHVRIIQDAEASGKMPLIDVQVALRACETLVAHPEMDIWVNLSQATLESECFTKDIGAIINDAGVANRIKLEITETHKGDQPAIMSSLEWFQDNQISVVVDDLGDEYSLSAFLNTDLVTGCKLSRATTLAMSKNNEHREAMRALIERCHAMEKSVTVEGVETVEQLNMARSLKADYVQGWLFWSSLPICSIPKPGSVGLIDIPEPQV